MQLPKVRCTAQILILHKYIYIFNDRVFTLFNNELMKFLLMCCDRSVVKADVFAAKKSIEKQGKFVSCAT